MMHTDRALTYDAWALELVAQQKWVVLNMEWSCDDPIEEEKGSPESSSLHAKHLQEFIRARPGR